MHGKPLIRVAAALIEQGGRYLITRRKYGAHLGGLWEFPGGKCEAGESFDCCVRRELVEELGIEITPPKFFMSHQHDYAEKIVELRFFSCTIHRGEPKALGCEEFCWVTAEELRNFEFPQADIPVLNLLVEMAAQKTKHSSMPTMSSNDL